ncbi:MAG: methyltransferase domain-containing protein [Verrucomicrobia bacterium]|nr:methyltransferase domain-containing protein [Verrucomicrobiota bacterium]
MDARTSEFYSTNASRLASGYAGVSPEFESRLLRTFEKSRRILDVGCGTGRDLGFLLKNGKDAFGVDASQAMLTAAQSALEADGLRVDGRLLEAELPDLSRFDEGEFDGILCSAVLMHLPEDKIFDTVYALRRVLKPGGTLLVSVPCSRSDVDPATRRDAHGRLFSDLPPAKLQLLFERVGFSVRNSEIVADSLGRDGIQWCVIEFVRLDESAERPLHLVEGILNRDKKDATYKLALFRALAEIAQTQNHLAAYTPEGKVKIPVEAIADKWMLYYWPIFESAAFIGQRTGEERGGGSGVAIRPPLETLINHFRTSGGLTGFYTDWKSGTLTKDAARLWKSARAKFQNTIWTMPVRHAGGGDFDVFQYDRLDKSICMDANLWRELCLTGSWIHDATILRWAELTEQLTKGAVKASLVIDCLLAIPDPARNVNDARRYFQSLPDRVCVWSDRSLEADFAVDHAMPFSLWRNNDLWNLFPAAPGINAAKSDKLPTYGLLHRQRDTIIHYWRGLDSALGERFAREAQTLLGRDPFRPGSWEPRLFARFVEAFEVTANQRGAGRWEVESRVATAPPVSRPQPSPVRYPEPEERMHGGGTPKGFVTANIIPFPEVGDGAFKTHLPIVGSLAAGNPFHGLEPGSLDASGDLDWIKVPGHLAKSGRFVVRVAGDSMEPTLRIGDLVVFEYHRSPRRDREIIIANLPEFGAGSPGTEAIKRITQDADCWIFQSDNPAHQPIRVSKNETSHPILGTMLEVLK